MNVFRSFSIYALSIFLVSGISFLLLPIFTRYLKPEDYGTLGLVTTTISLVTPLIGLSSYGSIQAQYFKLGKENIGSFTYSALVNNFIAFCIATLLMILLYEVLGNLVGISFLWFLLVPVITFCNVVPQTTLTLFQTDKKPFQFAIFSIFQAAMNLGLGIFFVVALKWNWEGRAWSLLITAVASAIIGFFLLIKNNFISFQYNRSYAKEAMFFGLPLIPHSIGAFLIDSSDRYFIAGYTGTKELGYYNVAYQVCFLLGLIDTAFSQSYAPFLYERLSEKKPDSNHRIIRLVRIYMLGMIAAVIGLIVIAPLFFDYFLGKGYSQGIKFIPWLAGSYFFLALYKIFAGFIFYHNRTIYLTYLSFVNISLNIVLNFIFISNYGAIGAAIATLLSCMVTAVVTYYFSQRVHRFNWMLSVS